MLSPAASGEDTAPRGEDTAPHGEDMAPRGEDTAALFARPHGSRQHATSCAFYLPFSLEFARRLGLSLNPGQACQVSPVCRLPPPPGVAAPHAAGKALPERSVSLSE